MTDARIIELEDELAKSQAIRAELVEGLRQSAETFATARAENERLRAALERLVELGEDDGSAPETAWKDAFNQAAELLGNDKAR